MQNGVGDALVRRAYVWVRGSGNHAHFAYCVFFFGGEKLPEIARGLGKGMRELQRALEETPEDDKRQERAQIERNSSTNNVVK